MANDLRSLIVSRPASTFLTICPILAVFSLSAAPSLIPVIILVTSLRLWSWIALPRADHKIPQVTQVLLVSFAAGATQLAPSLQALSTPSTALIVLSLLSLFMTSIAFVAFFISHYAMRVVGTPWTRITVFPALWASTWGFMSRISPMGHLASWSPVVGLGAYDWIREIFGQWGIDWITAAWAVVLSEILGDWLVGVDQQDIVEQEVLIDTRDTALPLRADAGDISVDESKLRSLSRRHSLLALTGILIGLMIPSYIVTSFPLPPQSSHTTPFTVGCALPATRTTGNITGIPTLEDYIDESNHIQAYAPVVLWPEGAVRFDTPEAKQDAFEHIQKKVQIGKGRYVGVSFEDYTPAQVEQGIYRPAMKRNGFALLGSTGPPVMEYYKRNLVPIAESFSLTPGVEDPVIYTIDLPAPKSYKKPDWSPLPGHTRPITVTASICFDFASSTSFAHLNQRPSIIFAPARTWHVGIGYAMWEQAKARAKETGSVVVWCDGGEGGVSGVASQGINEIVQVGQGTWTRTIGLQYEFDDRRTIFIRAGEYTAFLTVWAVLGLGWVIEIVASRRGALTGAVSSLAGTIRQWSKGRKNDEERPLLHD